MSRVLLQKDDTAIYSVDSINEEPNPKAKRKHMCYLCITFKIIIE